ncbi:DUF1684 domain-containing protein [Halopenitus persicus]
MDEHDGVWLLNFNRAYNPFCAYFDVYGCRSYLRESS